MATVPISPLSYGERPAAPRLPQSHRLDYIGPTGTMFAIFYKNLVLTILTLGIYRFWAKTRLRRFQWANTRIDGEGFEYTGTGKELFLGFLKAVAILLPLFGGLQVLELLVLEKTMMGIAALSLFRVVLIVGLIYAGTFSARKFRMSRTTWRGIRFQQTGSMWRYAGIALLGFLLTALTLGLYLPFLEAKLARYETDNLRFGSAKFRFSGEGKALLKMFLWVWVPFVVLASGVGLTILYLHTAGLLADPKSQAMLGLLPFAVMVVLYPSMFWYMARAARFRADNTHVEGLSLAMPRLTGWRIFGLLLGNSLLVGLSLGILYPLTTQRTIRFWIRHLELIGTFNVDVIAQAERGPKTGEGLAGFFDIDVG